MTDKNNDDEQGKIIKFKKPLKDKVKQAFNIKPQPPVISLTASTIHRMIKSHPAITEMARLYPEYDATRLNIVMDIKDERGWPTFSITLANIEEDKNG